MEADAPHSMGTTIIGVTYNGGVILGADSRTSTGVYVANRASDKITQLTDNVCVCRSGSMEEIFMDCLNFPQDDYVKCEAISLHYILHTFTIRVQSCFMIQLGQPATVKVAANLVRLLAYNNKSLLLHQSAICYHQILLHQILLTAAAILKHDQPSWRAAILINA
ncbi:Proteasome, subunit alpha/beta [Dillenia turbinata]|uniref:Proteasome, subunit alpha/beta n=1 Tax=Dillenia turbinata TaxID=194707 RepID=A0AAN8V596_9MAGN